MTSEFPRPVRTETIGDAARAIAITADADERRRLAGRFGLIAVDALSAEFSVRRDAAGIVAEGRVCAAVRQACVATGDPVPAQIDEPVSLRFVAPSETTDDIELHDDTIDTIEIEGDAIDLGEAAAETMALALDPYPRSPAAAEALAAAGVKREDEAGAFGALATLRDRLAKE